MKNENKIDIETLWQQNVERAKLLYASRHQNQMEIARVALEVCEISWGGTPQTNKFTLLRFAEECGISSRTLSNWVGVRRAVFEKLPPEASSNATFTQLAAISARVKPDAPRSHVFKVYDDLVNVSSVDLKMRKYIGALRSTAYNFSRMNAADAIEKNTLEEVLFYAQIIVGAIKKTHPESKPTDHGLASKNKIRGMSAAQALMLPRNHFGERETVIGRDGSGVEVRITPKDRDIIQFLKKNKGKWLTPTEIGMKLKGHNRNSASAWAYRTVNKFIGTELIERNNRGAYRWSGK